MHAAALTVTTPHVVTLDTPRTLDAGLDGTPYLTYYDDGLSFVWDGDPTDPVAVSSGGSGEPYLWWFLVPADTVAAMTAGTVRDTLAAFRATCAAAAAVIDAA